MDDIQVQSRALDGAQQSLRLAAEVSLDAIFESPHTPALLRNTLSGWISWQKRVETNVARALFSPGLAPEWFASLLALGARVVFLENHEAALVDCLPWTDESRDKVAAIRLPLEVPGRVWGEAYVRRTPADEPIVAAIATVDLNKGKVQHARLALTGVWPGHARLVKATELLLGHRLTSESITTVVQAVGEEVSPRDDFRGSAAYRLAMAGVVTRRALTACMNGADRR
jgi:CO/xanthine dehydrogenase FAD-binding subunit